MSLFAKDPKLIYQESIDFLLQNTALSSVGPGSRFRALVEIFGSQLNDAYKQFDFNSAISLIYGARGEFLDYLGEIFQVKRLKASYASVSEYSETLKFYTPLSSFGSANNGKNIVIPAGTEFWGMKYGQRIIFTLSDSITLSKDSKEAFITAQAVDKGLLYNMPAGTIVYTNFTDYTDYKNNSLLVVNTESIENATDNEPDDNYRYRILNQKFLLATGNETAIRLAALSVPGVADVVITPCRYGTGTALVIVKSTTPTVSTEILTSVEDAIADIKPAFSNVVVQPPAYVYLSFILYMEFKPNTAVSTIDEVKRSVTLLISDYVNNLDIGQTFYSNTLANEILAFNPAIASIGRNGKFFEKIYASEPVLDQYLQTEILTNYVPEELTKLLIATTNPVRFV